MRLIYDRETEKEADKKYEELCNLALELAKTTETRKAVLSMIHYPAWCTPPKGLEEYADWAAEMRKKPQKSSRSEPPSPRSRSSPASSMTATPSSEALASLLPASSPATR